MAPKKGETKVGAKVKPGKGVIKVATKEPDAPKVDQGKKSEAAVATLNKKDVRDFLGHVRYHSGLDKSKQPKTVDADARAILKAYNSADSETKTQMLEKFKGPGGKKLQWVNTFTNKETEETVDETESLAKAFTGNEILKMNGIEPFEYKEPPESPVINQVEKPMP